MARQDIQIDTEYGELDTTSNLAGQSCYDFALLSDVSGVDTDNYCYGEVIIPMNYQSRVTSGFEARVYIAYAPIDKVLRVRFRVDFGNDQVEYVLNPTNNSQWYEVTLPDGGAISLATYIDLSENEYYNLLIVGGTLHLYSGADTDLSIAAALSQNQSSLLKASAGTLYQYPTTGVGLIDYLHGNFENTGLAAKLQAEFEADNMTIINAYMDSATGELLLEVEEKEA